MRSLLAGIAFLTRFPAGRIAAFDSAAVSGSAGWFPLIGLSLGTLYWIAAVLLQRHLPLPIVGVSLVLLDAMLTGGLHFDGLADTADGFGGGASREDVLRIMRDHSIGSYGALALIVCAALKITAYAALLQPTIRTAAFILAPGLGRWSILLLTAILPYARCSPSVAQGMGKRALVWGTGTMALALAAAREWRAWIAVGAVLVVSAAFGFYCRRRIGGVTGDTLGANVQLCESAALLVFVWR
jgi:adenosylcobinamide-GDP ribazoletransferase